MKVFARCEPLPYRLPGSPRVPIPQYKYGARKAGSKLKNEFQMVRSCQRRWSQTIWAAMSIFRLSAPSRPPSLNLSSSPFDQTGQPEDSSFPGRVPRCQGEHSRLASTSVIDFPPSCDHSLFVTFSCRLFNTLQPNQFHIFVNALRLEEPDGKGRGTI